MNFILIVVNQHQRVTADYLNSIFPQSDTCKVQTVFVGQSILGIQYKGQRPNIVIKNYQVTTEKEIRWENEVLKPAVTRNAVWL